MAEGENVPNTRTMYNGTQRIRNEVLSPDGKAIQFIQIIDYDTLQVLTLVPQNKITLLTNLKDLPEEPENLLEEMRNIITELQEDPDFSVELLGEQELDGQITIVVRATGPDGEFKVWADPQTHLPIRIEQKWRQMEIALTDFEFDVELDESLFSMEIPEGYSEPQETTLSIEGSTEQDLIVTLRMWAEIILDGTFPRDLNGQVYVDDVNKNREKFMKLSEKERLELGLKMQPGFIFALTLKDKNDWHYVGKDVKLGDREAPICWYKPTGSQMYHVIYGDLTIEYVRPEDLPK
jgi:outer membrane lipoprotein-sorting protein